MRTRRAIEQRQLCCIGGLEDRYPFIKIGTTDRLAVPRRRRIPSLDASPELVDRHVAVVQFDADTEATSHGSHLVTFDPRPEPKIEDDAEAEAQDLLGQSPEFLFNLLPGGPVPRGGAKRPLPLVLREADSASLRGKLDCQCGLARPGQTTRENKSGLRHGTYGKAGAVRELRSRHRLTRVLPTGKFWVAKKSVVVCG